MAKRPRLNAIESSTLSRAGSAISIPAEVIRPVKARLPSDVVTVIETGVLRGVAARVSVIVPAWGAHRSVNTPPKLATDPPAVAP